MCRGGNSVSRGDSVSGGNSVSRGEFRVEGGIPRSRGEFRVEGGIVDPRLYILLKKIFNKCFYYKYRCFFVFFINALAD